MRCGFSHRTMLSFRSPVPLAGTSTWVGCPAFLMAEVSGRAMMLGLWKLPVLFWNTSPGRQPVCSLPEPVKFIRYTSPILGYLPVITIPPFCAVLAWLDYITNARGCQVYYTVCVLYFFIDNDPVDDLAARTIAAYNPENHTKCLRLIVIIDVFHAVEADCACLVSEANTVGVEHH